MENTKEKLEQVYQQVLRRTMTDEEFRKELIANPSKAIEEETGFAVPANYNIRIIDYDPAYQGTYVLPPLVGEDVGTDELDAVAGGSCIGNFAPCGAEACGAHK